MALLLLAALLLQDPGRVQALEALARRDRRAEAPKVLPFLADRDPAVAWQAAHTLLAMEAREVVPSLVPLLKDVAGQVRPNVVHVFGRLGDPAHGPLVAPLLDDPEEDVRLAAIRLLGEMRCRDFAGRLERPLKHSDPAQRQAAVTALAAMGARDRADLIAERLEDGAFLVRWEAARALGRLRASEHAPAVLALLQREGAEPPLLEAVGALGRRDSAPLLLPFLENPDAGIRWRATRALGQVDAVDEAAHIEHMLSDLEGFVRLMAVRALGELGARAKMPRVIERMEDPVPEVVHAAALETLFLGGQAEREAVPKLLGHEDPVTREAALELLAAWGRRDAAPAVRLLLRDGAGGYRWRVVRALGHVGSREDAALLAEILEKGDAFARPQAALALGRLAPGTVTPAPAGAPAVLRIATGLVAAGRDRKALRALVAEFVDRRAEPEAAALEDGLLDLLLRGHTPAAAAALERPLKSSKRIETRAALDALLLEADLRVTGGPSAPLARRLPAGTSLPARLWILAALGEELRLVPDGAALRAVPAAAAWELWQKTLDGD